MQWYKNFCICKNIINLYITISWYSISISREGVIIFNGYFSVDVSSDSVLSFHESINGITNFSNNILGPNSFPEPFEWFTSQNTYNNNGWGVDGTNISSISLQNAYEMDTPYFNIFDNSTLWRGIELPTNFIITPITDPTINIENPSIYIQTDTELYEFLNSNRGICIIQNDIEVDSTLKGYNCVKSILSNNLVKIIKN